MNDSKTKPIVTFPEWGSHTLVLRMILESLGVECISYQHSTKKHLEEGLKHSPDTICFCFKPVIGGLLEAVNNGANTVFWFDSHGQCRARYYSLLQEMIFERLGHKVDFFIFDGKNILQQVKKLSGKSSLEILAKLFFGYRLLSLIEEIEKMAAWYRPREEKKGMTEKVLKEAISRVEKISGAREIPRARLDIKALFKTINARDVAAPKVLLLGEIYVVHDDFSSHDLIRHLGNLGFEVINVHSAKEILLHYVFNPYFRWKMDRIIRPYLSVHVGGHAGENIKELILHCQKHMISGVVHVAPFGCMPEVTVNPILQKIARERNIPFLFITFDEQTSDTGLMTRLEAFADLMNQRHA